MRRFYYFGCRGTESGHYIHASARNVDGNRPDSNHLDGGFPVHILDGTFTPLDTNDKRWRLTQLRFNHHIISILSCHDNTIDTRPGSNASFIVIDSDAWDAEAILGAAREKFPDCWNRLRDVKGK